MGSSSHIISVPCIESMSPATVTAVDAILCLIPAFLSSSGVPVSSICVPGHCICCRWCPVPDPCVLAAPWSCCPLAAVVCLMPLQFVSVPGQVPEAVAVAIDSSCASPLQVPPHYKIKLSHLSGHRFSSQVMYSANSNREKCVPM